jgi:hypothetical protein
MKNKAKCKLCSSIIESFHPGDTVTCKCGEIVVFGGDAMHCRANDYANFLRIDDNGNEIVVKYVEIKEKENPDNQPNESQPNISRDELIQEVERLIEGDEELLAKGLNDHVRLFDVLRYIIRLVNILKRE